MLIGIMLFMVVNALGELACVFPIQGSFSVYSTRCVFFFSFSFFYFCLVNGFADDDCNRFLHPSWGFAMGWNYVMSWIVTLPTELSAAVLVIQVSNRSLHMIYMLFTCVLIYIYLPLVLGQDYDACSLDHFTPRMDVLDQHVGCSWIWRERVCLFDDQGCCYCRLYPLCYHR